jgi:hypothetical protein
MHVTPATNLPPASLRKDAPMSDPVAFLRPAITAITAAAPGWTAMFGDPGSGDKASAPIAAWAARTPDPDSANPFEPIDPVFPWQGEMYTGTEFRAIYGYLVKVHPPAAQVPDER